MATQIGQLKYSIGFDVKKQDLNALKAQLQQLSKLKISDIMKFNDTDRSTAIRMLNDIKTQAQKVQDALTAAFNVKLNTANVETFNKSLKSSGTSLEQVYNTLKQGGMAGENAFRSLVTQVTTANTQLKQTHKFLDNIATTLSNTIKWNLASSAINTLSGSIQQAWGYVKSLDNSLNDIRIVTNKSAEQMENFAVQANKAAQSLGKTTTDYTKAALIYAQQGLDDEQIAERTAITLKTANVTGQSADAVSEQLTAVWNGYKVNAEEAEIYVDRLAAVAATTASDLQELSTGMSKVASAAAAMGVGQDQLAAQLSTIISVTRQAPESVGTALRTVYARISDIKAGIDEDGVSLGNYSGKMAELGFNVLDVAGNLRDMGQVMQEIGGRWQSLTREQQVSLAQTMAGQRQYSNLIALFDNFEQYNKALNTAQNAAGTLQKQQDTYMDSMAAHLNQLKASTEDLYDSLVNADSIKPLISGLTTVTNLTAKFVDALGGGGNILLTLGGIATNVFSNQLTKGIQTFVHNLTLAKERTQEVENRIKLLRDASNYDNVDENTQFMFDKYADDLKSIAPTATNEQLDQLFQNMQRVTQAMNDFGIAAEKAQKQNEHFLQLQKQTDKQYEDIFEFIKANQDEKDAFYKQLIQNQQKQVKVNAEISESIGRTSTALQKQYEIQQELNREKEAQNLTDQKKEEINQKLIESQNRVNKLLDDQIQELQKIKDVDFAGAGFEDSKKQIDDLIVLFERLKNEGLNPADFAPKIAGIQKLLESIPGKSKEEIEQIFKKIKKLEEELEHAGQKLKNQGQNYDSFLKGFADQKKWQAVGRLVGSVTQLGTSVKITSNAFNELGKGNIGAGLAGLVTSLTSVTTAAVSAGKAIKAMGASLGTASVIGIALAAIQLVVSGLVAWKQAAEEARQAQIDLNNQVIENQQKNQEQIDKKQELLSAIKDLNEEYENGQITRADLRSEIEKLCDQYGIEESYIDNLIDRYGDLAQGIKQARIEAAKQKQESLQTQFEAVRKNVQNDKAGQRYSIGYTSVDLSDNVFVNLLSNLGAKIESQYDTWSEQFWSSFVLPENIEDKINIYNALSTQLQKHKDDPLYNDLKKWYDDFSASAEKYNDIKERLDSYLDYDIFSNQYADFDQTKTFEEYKKQRQQLIDNVAQGDAEKAQQVTRAVDKYLRQNYKGLYGKYDETLNYVGELEKRFEKIDQDILDSIKELDAAHLDELQRRKIDDYEDLRDVLKEVSQLDLSNVQAITNANPASLQQVAADRYTFFKSLEDQVRSGKSISSKQIERFGDYGAAQLAQYFTMMANGQYQMTEDAKKFYETILNFELSGFFDVIDALQNKAKQLEKFDEYLKQFDNDNTGLNEFDYESLRAPALLRTSHSQLDIDRMNRRTSQTGIDSDKIYKQVTQDKVNKYKIQDQLEFIKIYKEQAEVTQQLIQQWEELNNLGKLQKQDAYDIADAIQKIGDKTQTYNEDINSVNQQLKQTEHQIYKVLFPTDVDIDETAVAQLSNVLQQLAPKSEELSNDLANNAAAAEQLAQAVLRFDDAIQDVIDHYDDWLLALQQQNLSLQDKAVILPQLRDAYADMLDLDGSLLTDDFLLSTQHLEWMKAAIDGDIQAYENLAEAARLASIQMLEMSGIDMSHFEADIEYLQRRLENFSQFSTLEIGAKINDQEFLNTLSEMLNKMNVTAAQASDILRQNLGIDTEIIEVKDNVKQTQEYPVTNAVLQPVDASGYVDVPVSAGRGISTQRLPLRQRVFSTRYRPDTQSITTTKEAASFALKVTSANKSAGGNFKYTNASRGGGSAGVKRRTEAAQKAAKAAKESTPKEVKPDTSTKDTKDYMKDDRDIYHDINIEISEINRELERTQKIQNRLFGKQLIANLNKQTDILEKQKTKLREKIELEKLDLEQQKAKLKLLGVAFDGDKISNYTEVLGNQLGVIYGLTDAYNSLAQQYSASTDKEAKDAMKDQISQAEKRLKDAQDLYKELKDAMGDYDSLRDDMEDLADEVTQIAQKQIEINITRFRMSLEISLDMSDARREWNKFKREVEQADDVLRDSEFIKLTKDTRTAIDDYDSYFDVKGVNSIQDLTASLNKYMDIIDQIDEKGTNAIYGDNKAQAMEDLQADLNKLMGSMEQIQQLIQSVDQAILDAVDDVSDLAQKQIEDYEFVNELYEHDIELLQLLYGDQEYAAMDAYYNKQQANQLKQIDFLKQYRDLSKQEWDAAVERGQSELAQKWKQEYMQAVRDINSAIVQSVELLKEKYTNAVNQIFDSLERSWGGGRTLEYVDLEWQLLNKNADEYLDTINKAYALQQLEQKYLKAIDEASGVAAQQAITQLMNEQLDNLKAKEKLTQYDVDRAEKLLQIEQARYALEETQKAKTSLRLKRDSQGNYSYVYAASEEDTTAAEDQLAKLQNQLYNFDKQAYKDNLNDILSAVRDFRNQYQEIILSDRSEEDKMQMLKLLRDQYNEYITNKTEENIAIRSNLTESAFIEYAELYQQDYEAFTNMTQAQKNDFMGTLVVGWNDGVQQMTDKFAGEGGFIETCQQAFNDLDIATQNYESELDELQRVADEDFGELKEGIDNVAEAFGGLITDNQTLIRIMQNDMINAIRGLKNELDGLIEKYAAVYEAANKAVNEANAYIQAQNKIAYDQASKPDNKQYKPPESQPQPQSLPTTPTPVPASTPAPATASGGSTSSGSSEGSSSSGGENPWTKPKVTATMQGIAGNIWYYGSWKNQPDRYKAILQVFGNYDAQGNLTSDKNAKKIYQGVQSLFNDLNAYGYNYPPPHDVDYYKTTYDYYEMLKKYRKGIGTSGQNSSFDTGGYTGAWGSEGRLAFLHQKELVLNAQDTKNMLDSVSILRNVVSNLGGSISSKLRSLNGGYIMPVQPKPTDELQQNVSIQASFPNVNSKREIEEAFSELVNMAAQRAMRRV